MRKKYKKKIFLDTVFVLISVAVAIYLEESGVIANFISLFGNFKILAAVIGGMFFTSVFTTASAIVLLGELSLGLPLFWLTLFAGIGSVLGDYMIFRFVKDKIIEDFKHIISYEKRKRIKQVFRRKLFRYFVPFIGGIILASPLPDELGITILSISKMKEKYFLPMSFTFNSLGILVIALIARGLFG